MAKLLIDYNFKSLKVKNSVGTDEIKFQNATMITGPGNTSVGEFPKAIDLGNSGKGNVEIANISPNAKQFCVQTVFKVNGTVSSRQNIMESNFLPFAVFAVKGSTNNNFHLVGSAGLKTHGWSGVDTLFKKTLQVNKWYAVSLVYDFDTLGLFIDDELVSVHGFPNGLIKTNTTKKLFFGTWVDGARDHLNGALAGFKWYDGIPAELETLLDERRSQAEWHITYKHAQIKSKMNPGKALQGIIYNAATGSHTQFYQNCGLMYHETVGVAFEMHGTIYTKYKAMGNKHALGYLVTDETKATITSGRKSLFSKGGIYWSSATGAVPVLDQIYLEYENLGESKALGFPTSAQTIIPGGKQQIFQKCRMYYKNGTGRAQEVHGSILTKYLNTGGPQKWGFPITNESDVKKGKVIKGKFSEFETCTIYWKSGIGAFITLGDIRRKYEDLKGPLGSLGFPTSDEVDIPNYSGAGKMNTFEKGSILWFGSFNSIKVALPFKIRLQRIHSKESEGWGMGQNDLHFYIKMKDGSTTIYDQRFPSHGDYGNHNVINPNRTFPVEIIPNKVNKRISFFVDIRDSDPGPDDHLGTHTTILSAANAWGYRQPNLVFNQSFSKIKTFLWSIRPKINISSLSEKEKWWKFDNFKTPAISRDQYAAAYRDVDSETEWWDILDGLRTLFYKWVVKGVASGGNCFGMSLEAIYARKNNSLLNQPLNQVIENADSKNEINIKHSYQVGARPIWWFLGEFVTGNTHDPKDVFVRTRSAFQRGDNPVVCIAQNYDFSGGPHCIMPFAWDTSSKPWKMKVMDPNFPNNDTKVITVDPDNNTFRYVGSRTYTGGAWSGGRFHYMPYCILDTPQRTPVWDAILLLLSGTLLILADDAETTSIKDANGKDLDGNGNRAKQVLKSGNKPEEFFASFVGFERAANIKPGQILLRQEKSVSLSTSSEVVNLTALPVATAIASRRLPGMTATLPSTVKLRNAMSGRSAHHIVNDSTMMAKLSDDLKNHLKNLVKINQNRNYQHQVKGVKNGTLEYLIRSGLTEIKMVSTIKTNEVNTIKVNDLNTNAAKIDLISPQSKNVNIEVINKLGVNGDHIRTSINNIPIQANKSLVFNIKQGIAGLEIVSKGVQVNLPVQLSGKVNGKKLLKNYQVPFKDAVRIKPASVINSDELVVSDIKNLFGAIKATKGILKQ